MPKKEYLIIHGNTLFICKHCNKKFKDYKSGKLGQNVFCSRLCSTNFLKGKPSWNKGILHTENHKINLRKAKKKEIERSWKKTGKNIPCNKCGKLVYKNKYVLDKYKNNYCSKVCASKVKSKKQIEAIRNLGRIFGKNKLSERHKRILSKLRKKDFREGKFVFPLKDSSIEIKIQNFLKLLHIEFFTHQYIHINHGYQCDIYIPSIKTIIEADGCYWHGCPICKLKAHKDLEKRKILDNTRTKELQEKGYRVIRLWEHEIKKMNINSLKEELALVECQ